MRVAGSNRAVVFAAIVFMLFGGYFAYAAFLAGPSAATSLVQTVSAKDGEDDDSDDDEDEDEDDEDEDKDDDEDDDRDGSGSGSRDDDDDDEDEDDDRRTTSTTRSGSSGSRDDDEDDMDDVEDEDEDGDEDENEVEDIDDDGDIDDDDRDEMFKDRNKTIAKLTKKIAQAEEKILEKQAEGVDVTAALAQLALAKSALSSVDAAFTAQELDKIKALAKATERLAHFARGKTLHDAEDVAKDIAKVAKRIAQTKGKISLLTQLGGDATVYITALKSAEADFVVVQDQIKAGGENVLTGLAALEGVERRVKSIKNSVEGALLALGVSDDDEFEIEHGIEIEDASDDLSELADADEDHDSLRALAQVHKSEASKVGTLVKELEERNPVARGLFGNDDAILNALRSEAVSNEGRILAMQAAADLVTDPELKSLILEKISELQAENLKLTNFIAAASAKSGILGWLFRNLSFGR